MMILLISNILMLLLGFVFGYVANRSKLDQLKREVNERVRPQEYGGIKRPTVEDLRRKAQPQQVEGDEAMAEDLDRLMGQEGLREE